VATNTSLTILPPKNPVLKPDDDRPKLDVAVLAPPSMMKEAECQTNPVLEEGILQEILDNTEIFQFIVTKQPSIIHKFYMMTKYARWFGVFVQISCDAISLHFWTLFTLEYNLFVSVTFHIFEYKSLY